MVLDRDFICVLIRIHVIQAIRKKNKTCHSSHQPFLTKRRLLGNGEWWLLHGGGQWRREGVTLQLQFNQLHRDRKFMHVHLPIVVHVGQGPANMNRVSCSVTDNMLTLSSVSAIWQYCKHYHQYYFVQWTSGNNSCKCFPVNIME